MHLAGHGHVLGGGGVGILVKPAGLDSGGHGFHVFQHLVLVAFLEVDVHHAAAAHAAQVGLDHADGKCGGYRGVHRVAAGLQDINADLAGIRAAAGHAAMGAHRAVAKLIAFHGGGAFGQCGG